MRIKLIKCKRCDKPFGEYNKWSLCPKCLSYMRKHHVLGRNPKLYPKKHRYVPLNSDPMNEREKLFYKLYSEGRLIFHPVRFRIHDTTYQPDFYDIERNVFIEISGTRQAYHANKEKYKLFRKIFPKIVLEIRNPNGTMYIARNSKE